MSAIPYNPQGPPQDEYVQQNQNQNQNQTGIAHAQQNDTGISYAPRRTTTNTYPPHEKGDFNAPVNQQTTPVHSQTSSPVHLQTSSPVHLHTAPVHSRMAPVHSYTAPVGPQTTPVNPQTAPVHPQTSPVYSQQPAVYTARPGTMIQSAQHFTPPIGPTQDWQHGMCGCFDSWSICMSTVDILNLSPLTRFGQVALGSGFPASSTVGLTNDYGRLRLPYIHSRAATSSYVPSPPIPNPSDPLKNSAGVISAAPGVISASGTKSDTVTICLDPPSAIVADIFVAGRARFVRRSWRYAIGSDRLQGCTMRDMSRRNRCRILNHPGRR